MMGPLEIILFAVLVLLSATVSTSEPGRVHKVTPPSSIPLPLNDETVITCEMNLIPDKFHWRFFPLGESQAFNPYAPLNLSATNYIDLPPSNYKFEKKKSTLTVKLTNHSMAGDYQCLAHYGASVIASVPDRITITTLDDFPPQTNTYINVSPGNTVVWRCIPPYSNPPAYIDYSKDGNYVQQSGASPTFLIIPNVSKKDSGTYKCRATNTLQETKKDSNCELHLNVMNTNNEPPRFIVQPQSTYTITHNERVFLECGAVGTPVPKVTWEKLNGELDKSRMQLLPGGLQISSGSLSDEGVYVCKHENSKGSISHKITLIYNQKPKIVSGPNSTHIKEGEELDLECLAEGSPEPKISWILNGKGVLNDNQIEAVGNRIYFRPFEKRHAGIIQCFASNQIGTTYSSADLEVIPKQISSANVVEDLSTLQPAPTHKHRKHKNKYKHKGTSEMIPPSKPTISRLNDESVVVRWSVPSNDGLPIQFFKVQYKELGPTNSENPSGGKSRWKTTNLDIAPNIRSYEVNNLKPDYIYKFRIAAVYSNNDNKLSRKSDKFHLIRADFFARNPLPIPTLTHTESVNDTSIRIFWEYTPDPNVTVDGFFINYMSASSAGDYMKATVDGEKTNSYVITHLAPDTVYDIKMQSFNSKTAGEFSSILKEKTEKITTEPPVTTTVKNKQQPEAHSSDSEMYIFIGAGIFVVALLLSVVVFLIICRKWKQNKDTDGNRGGDRGDKVDEINHHIQAEANDYVVTPKNLGRNNGCALPQNRITITANPLADADNKSQNMIEMSCLTAQNNNCNPSASNQDQQQPSKHKNRENKRRKTNSESQPGENYV